MIDVLNMAVISLSMIVNMEVATYIAMALATSITTAIAKVVVT